MTPNNFDVTPRLDGYSHLWMEVLRQALDDATARRTSAETAVETRLARRWLNEDGAQIGSLRWICDVLNISIDVIRKEFRRRSRQRQRRPARANVVRRSRR